MGVGALLALIWCAGAAVTDVRSRRISNRWLLAGFLATLVWRAAAGQMNLDSVWGAFFGACALFLPFWLGGIGAGDLKLMTLVGFMCGFRMTVVAALLTGVAGAVMAICIRFDLGKAGWWLGRPLAQAIPAVPEEDGFATAGQAGTIPYAVAILLGVLGAVFWPGGQTP